MGCDQFMIRSSSALTEVGCRSWSEAVVVWGHGGGGSGNAEIRWGWD